MRRQDRVNPIAVALVLMLALAACGGNDSDSELEATSTALLPSPEPRTATSTTNTGESSPDTGDAGDEDETPASDATAAASPTSDSRPTPAVSPTATTDGEEPVVEPEPTETLSAIEDELLSVLLTDDDLPDGWATQGESGPVPVENSDGEELCGPEDFPDESFATGQVAAQFLNEEAAIVMLQKIWAFEDGRASDAFSFWKDASECGEWTDPGEHTVSVEELDDPGLGDQSFAVHLSFEANEAELTQGEYIFIRSDDLLMLIAYVGSDDADFTPLADPIETATERLQEVAAELESES